MFGVPIVDDNLVEGEESFSVSLTLSNPVSREDGGIVFLGNLTMATVTIIDNDSELYNNYSYMHTYISCLIQIDVCTSIHMIIICARFSFMFLVINVSLAIPGEEDGVIIIQEGGEVLNFSIVRNDDVRLTRGVTVVAMTASSTAQGEL